MRSWWQSFEISVLFIIPSLQVWISSSGKPSALLTLTWLPGWWVQGGVEGVQRWDVEPEPGVPAPESVRAAAWLGEGVITSM